jgi:hypothetical protein
VARRGGGLAHRRAAGRIAARQPGGSDALGGRARTRLPDRRRGLTVFLGVLLAARIGLTGTGEELALPLLATQILWINLLTDTGPALAMGVDPETDDVMSRPPRALHERVIDGRMWRGVLLIGLVMAVVTLVTIDLYLPGGLVAGTERLDTARTAGFTVLVFAQLFNSLNARSERPAPSTGCSSTPGCGQRSRCRSCCSWPWSTCRCSTRRSAPHR